MSERDVYNFLGGMSLGIALIGVGVIVVSWVTVAYCRIAKWRIRRTLDREIPLAAAFTALGKSEAEVARLRAVIAAVLVYCECFVRETVKQETGATE